MKNLISSIQKMSTGKNVVMFVVPALVIYVLMLFYTIPGIEKYLDGMKLFDLSPGGYSHEYANELLAKLGEGGRELYLYNQLPLDFLYPGLFAISGCLLLSWLFLQIVGPSSKLFYCCLIPVAAGLLDYIENIYIVNFITSYPDISRASVGVSSMITIGKSVTTTLFFVVLILAGITYFTKRVKRG